MRPPNNLHIHPAAEGDMQTNLALMAQDHRIRADIAAGPRAPVVAPSATLAICFHNGAVYHYSPVPEPLYAGLIAAPSAGSFFHENIRNAGFHYHCVQLERPNLLTPHDL